MKISELKTNKKYRIHSESQVVTGIFIRQCKKWLFINAGLFLVNVNIMNNEKILYVIQELRKVTEKNILRKQQ